MNREELIAGLRDIAEEYKNRGVPSCALTIEAALTALQDREAVVRECAAVAKESVADCEGTIASQNFVANAILKLLEPK